MKTNLKICLVLSLFGILLLIFLSSHLIPPRDSIINLTEKELDNSVAIYGRISEMKKFEESKFYILTITDKTGSITGTLNSKNLSINKTQEYLIIGKITKYENETQIIIGKIIENDS